MRKNIRKKDHPIQYEIARLKRRCAENAEEMKLIGKGILAMVAVLGVIYGSGKLPAVIEKIKQKQAENRENAIYRFENMSTSERDKIWTREQQQVLFDHIAESRSKGR